MLSWRSPFLQEVRNSQRALKAAPWLETLHTKSRLAGERRAGGTGRNSLTRTGFRLPHKAPRSWEGCGKARLSATPLGYGPHTCSLQRSLDKGPPPLILRQLPSWSSLFSKFNSLKTWSIIFPHLDTFTVPRSITSWALIKKTKLRKVRRVLRSHTANH